MVIWLSWWIGIATGYQGFWGHADEEARKQSRKREDPRILQCSSAWKDVRRTLRMCAIAVAAQ
jgi:hypothetical protein